MTRVLAQVIAKGTDEITPAYIHAEHLDIKPLLESGIASFSRFAPEEYQCSGCAGCDAGPEVKRIFDKKEGAWRHHLSCQETSEFISDEEVSAYCINLDAFFEVVSSAFGCGRPVPIQGVDGAWDFGMSGIIKAKHPRRVVFMRRLEHYSAAKLTSNAMYGDGLILIAAALDRRVREDGLLTAIALSETLRYQGGRFSFDMEPVTERFKLRTAELARTREAGRKPSRPTHERMKALATYLKDRAVEILNLYAREIVAVRNRYEVENGEQDVKLAYDRTNRAMSAVTVESIVAYFEGQPNERTKMGQSTIYNYLDKNKYPGLAESEAARFWLEVCANREMMQLVSIIIRKEKKTMMESSLSGMDGVSLWGFVNRHIETYARDVARGELSLYE